MSKKVYIAAGLVLAGLVVFGIWSLKNKPTDNQNQQVQVEVKPVDKNQLPTRFPSDFPIESGAEIKSNYNAENETSIQATRLFVSKKTAAENFKLYSDYLKNNGWNIITTLDQEALKVIAASKGSDKLDITINLNSVSNQVTVDVSFLGQK